jgi:putative membrane protein
MIELAVALFVGILAGTFTGLIPGVHTNLLAVALTASVPSFGLPVLPAVVFIASMAIAHTFISFIPSVFLGAPEEDTFLSVLPGHQLLKDGSAHEAVVLTLYGSLIALTVIIFFIPLFLFAIPIISGPISRVIPFILIFVSSFLVLREKNFVLASSVFLLSGFLGFASLDLPVRNALLPLLSGLFGASSLIVSIKSKPKIPKQNIPKLKEITPYKKEIVSASIASAASAPLCSFLPGIGAGHAAIIGSEIISLRKNLSMKGFIILLGAINTIVMGLSFITFYSIGRTRTGAAAAVKDLMPVMSFSDLGAVFAAIILSGAAAFFIALNISKYVAKNISKISYLKTSIITLAFISAVVFAFSGPVGLFIFVTSTALGVFAILSGSRRTNLMGCLLIPTILFYLF